MTTADGATRHAEDRRQGGTWSRRWQIVLPFARVTEAKPWHYLVPLALTLTSASLEGALLSLLLPLASGLATDDLTFVWKVPGIREWHARFPEALGAVTSPNRSAFLVIIAILFATTLLGLVTSYLALRVCSWRDQMYAARVRSFTVGRCLSFGLMYFDRSSSGAVAEVVAASEAILNLLRLIERSVDRACRLIAQAVVMVVISWPLTLLLVLALPLLRAVDTRLVRRSHVAAKKAAVAEMASVRKVHDVLSCMPLVKAYGLEDRIHRAYAALIDQQRTLVLRREGARLTLDPLQQGIALTVLVASMCVAVALATTDHTAGLSAICAFLLVTRRVIPTLSFVSELRVGLAVARPQLDRLVDAFDDEGKCFVVGGDREFSGVRRGIELRGLSFSYGTGPTVLRGVTAYVRAGCTTALVGETGCGKTTIARLITRLYQCPPGSIFIDGIDIREFSLASLAKRTSFVGQEAWLLNDTIRANLLFGLDRHVGDDVLLSTLEQVRLSGMVLRQRNGLDTEIGDRGLQLSGGERQRLCIARAILRESDLLVLDEATASLDSQTEHDVQRVLEDASRGRTVLTIAHRLSTVRHADTILVLSQGGVIQEGAWAELVYTPGAFADMWHAQAGGTRGPLRPLDDRAQRFHPAPAEPTLAQVPVDRRP